MAERLELEFKRWLKKRWRGFSSSVEYALGGDEGHPDQLFWAGVWLPVELKVGEIKNDRLWPREVRPAQVVWHQEAAKVGGDTRMLVGVPADCGRTWDVFQVDGFMIRFWKEGYVINDRLNGCVAVVPEAHQSWHDALHEAFTS